MTVPDKLVIDHTAGDIVYGEKRAHLPAGRWRFFARLLRSRGHVVGHQLMVDISETASAIVVRTQLSFIREVLVDLPLRIETVWGWGYRLVVEPGIEIQEIKANG